jgi:hypothetical protein
MSDDTESLTTTVSKAGKYYLNLTPAASYRAAARGDIPTIKVGRLLRVPRAAMVRRLGELEEARKLELAEKEAKQEGRS